MYEKIKPQKLENLAKTGEKLENPLKTNKNNRSGSWIKEFILKSHKKVTLYKKLDKLLQGSIRIKIKKVLSI